MLNVHSTFSVLRVGNILCTLSAKGVAMPTELHTHGLSQNVEAAQISGKNPRPTRLQKRIPSKEESLAFSPNNPKVDGVQESALHSDLGVASSGESLKNFIRPFHLQFLLLLPRVIKAMMALMTASQNPQASIILGWHPGSICFLPGLCTFLRAPSKHFGKVFCKPVQSTAGPWCAFSSWNFFSLLFLIVIDLERWLYLL